jgi:two-component system, OmpR family, sensor histidine kinase VicK
MDEIDFEDSSAFLENASVSIHYVGEEGTILWANDLELETLGYSREEYIGKDIRNFHEDKIVAEDILQRLLNGEKLHNYPAVVIGKNKKRYFIISSNAYFEKGNFIHTRCFSVDIPKYAFDTIKQNSSYFKGNVKSISDS